MPAITATAKTITTTAVPVRAAPCQKTTERAQRPAAQRHGEAGMAARTEHDAKCYIRPGEFFPVSTVVFVAGWSMGPRARWLLLLLLQARVGSRSGSCSGTDNGAGASRLHHHQSRMAGMIDFPSPILL
jgi:hypothetical protein